MSLWIFSFPRLRDCALPSDRLRVVACGVDPVSSRIVARRFLAGSGYDMQTPCPSSAARRPLVHFVSPDQCWLTVRISHHRFGKLRLFRSTLPGQHRRACKFFGNCISRGVSRQYRDATRFDVLAWRSHVALRWPGMALAVHAGFNLFPRPRDQAIAQRKYNSPADYARPTWRTLDVCARSAV